MALVTCKLVLDLCIDQHTCIINSCWSDIIFDSKQRDKCPEEKYSRSSVEKAALLYLCLHLGHDLC